MWLSGSKVKQTSMVNQTFSLSDSRQIRFPRAGNSANQISRRCEFSQSGFEELEIQPIRFQRAGSSANQVWRSWKFSQSGFEESGIQSIRFQRTGRSANQVFRGRKFNESHVFGVPVSPDQVFLESGDRAIRGKDRTL